MKETKPIEETKRYAICPKCNEKTSAVDHLLATNTETRWYCDNCGWESKLSFKNGKMFIGESDKRIDKTLVLLKAGHVALVVEGMKFINNDEDDNYNHDKYHYNEHTCPTNYMSNVLMIVDLRSMDHDPHGIFEYIETVPYDERIKEDGLLIYDLFNISNIRNSDLVFDFRTNSPRLINEPHTNMPFNSKSMKDFLNEVKKCSSSYAMYSIYKKPIKLSNGLMKFNHCKFCFKINGWGPMDGCPLCNKSFNIFRKRPDLLLERRKYVARMEGDGEIRGVLVNL